MEVLDLCIGPFQNLTVMAVSACGRAEVRNAGMALCCVEKLRRKDIPVLGHCNQRDAAGRTGDGMQELGAENANKLPTMDFRN